MAGDFKKITPPIMVKINGEWKEMNKSVVFTNAEMKEHEIKKPLKKKYDVPDDVIEKWAEKANRYDRIAKAILKEDLHCYDICPEEVEHYSDLDELIWSILIYIIDGIDTMFGPDASDYLDPFYIKE